MSDERNLYNFTEFWYDCVDHFERSGGLDAIKQRDEVDHLHQLLITGQSFIKIDPSVISTGAVNDVVTPSPPLPDESCNVPEPQLPQPQQQPAEISPAPNKPTTPATKSTGATSNNKSLKHKCDTCSQVFDSKIALSIHTGRIHKHEGRDKNYRCQMCPKTFFNSSYLAQHMRIHTGNKPYPCPECDKRFTQLSHLQQHKRTHTGEKPYKCQQPGCTKAFSQLSNLQSHTRSHLPDGNVHKCTSCYKCYYDEASLNAHMKTHMENKRVRNYRCEECGKSYTQDTYLQNHINNKHGGSNATNLETVNTFPNRAPAQRQPTSIQAATSMICKMEEPSAPCGFSGMVGQPPVNKLAACDQQAPNPSASSFPQESVFSGMPFDCAPSDRTSSGYPDTTGSAFKPVIRQAFDSLDSGTGVPPGHLDTGINRPQPIRGYEQPPQVPGDPSMSQQQSLDIKPSPEDMADSDFYWRLKNNMAAGLGNYSHLPSQIQNYMASQANYHPYAAHMSNPLDGLHTTDKMGGSAYSNDAMCDYLMGGGLREAYQYD